MTSKIFRNSFLVGVAVFFLSIALFMGVLYQYFGSQLLIQLESEAALAARGEPNAPSPARRLEAVARLAEAGVPTVAVALRGPYDLAGLPESVWTLAAFEYTEQSIRAVARVLRGEAEPTGRLPVTL